ncbi:MAG: 6-bladed beta-propeller, partial [Bacteroidia bacterium]|nr:6-bladed beta-propeller [Bacteroidia bacterium]
MNNKAVITAFLFIAFTFTGGSAQTKKEDLIRIKIDAGQFKSSGNVSDYLEVVKLIPLETTKECLIGEIDKVVQFRNNIYVVDSRTYNLLWFDSSGKFLGQIGQRGKGPGEYIEMHDFLVDTINELIYLLDFRKVHIFSTKGKWIRTANTEFMAYALYKST